MFSKSTTGASDKNPSAPRRVESTNDKLDRIIHHLARMDQRDRWRTWGGFVRSIIGLVPVLVLLGSLWYFYQHGDQLIKQMTQQVVKQSAQYQQGGMGDLYDQLKKYIK